MIRIICMAIAMVFNVGLVYSQTVISNLNYNQGNSFPQTLGNNVTGVLCTDTANTSTVFTNSGTTCSVLQGAFYPNTIAGNAVTISNSSGVNTKYFLFTYTGVNLSNYSSFGLFFQAYRPSAGAQYIKIEVSTDGFSFSQLDTDTLSAISSWKPFVHDFSANSAINNTDTLVFKLSLSGASGTGNFRIDNLQLSGYCSPAAEPLMGSSGLLVVNNSCFETSIKATSGSGDGRLFIIKQGSSASVSPQDLLFYGGDSVYGQGYNFGSSTYAIYSGADSVVTLTGLSPEATYYVSVFEYSTTSQCPESPNYNIDSVYTISFTVPMCYEIKNVLVDACVNASGIPVGICTNEGQNEMLTLITGPAPLHPSLIAFTWASAPWKGIETDTSITNPLLRALQATVLGCGHILNPFPQDTVPAGKQLLLITSTDFCLAANSFANLNDSIWVVFQKAGNTGGHFGNSTSGNPNTPRVTTGTYNGQITDQVAYLPALLVGINGLTFQSVTIMDGASVDFSDSLPRYYNNGCNAPFDPFTVTLNVSGTTTNLTACPYDTVYVKANVEGGLGSGYVWTTNGVNQTFLQNFGDSVVYVIDSAQTGSFSVFISLQDQCNINHTDSVAFNFSSIATANLGGSDTLYICPGVPATLNVGNSIGSTFTWSTGDVGNSVIVDTVGTIYLTSVNVCGSATDSVLVAYTNIPDTTLTIVGSLAFCQGDSVRFSVVSQPNTTYQWYNGSTMLAGQDSSVFVALTSGAYSCMVTKGGACKLTTMPKLVTVNALPPSNAGLDQVVCPGNTITLGVGAVAGNSYTWSSSPAGFTTNLANPTITINAAATYFLEVINLATSCRNSDTVEVTLQNTVVPSVQVSVTNDTICNGGVLVATASTTTGGVLPVYSWFVNGAYNASSSTGQLSYSPQNGDSIRVQLNSSLSCAIPSTAVSNTIKVVVLDVPTVSITSSSVLICNGNSVGLTVVNPVAEYQYTWNNNQIGSGQSVSVGGTYTVTASNFCGQVTSNPITLTSNQSPVVGINANDTVHICQGDVANLVAATLQGTGVTYSWTNGITGSTLQTASEGLIEVTGTNQCGTSNTAYVYVKPEERPDAEIINSTVVICNGSPVLLVASSASNYTWSNGSFNSTSLYNVSGMAYLTVNSLYCGMDIDSVLIQEVVVDAVFTPSVYEGFAPLTVDFSNASLNAFSYQWEFGNGSTSADPVPAAYYSEAGLFTVVLTAFNMGCSDTAMALIRVKNREFKIEFPNIFTPNGDGNNELFKPLYFEGIKECEFSVYSRWGQELYRSSANPPSWDGRFGGVVLPDGVYYYIAKFKTYSLTEPETEQSGYITLVK